MEVRAAVRRWVETWAASWPAHEAGPIAALYADGARFGSAPFREPHVGPAGVRAYCEWAFADEESADARFGEPIVDGNRATVEYWAVIRAGGREQTLSGIAVLRFAPDGRVADQRDYWTIADGRRAVPPGWGR